MPLRKNWDKSKAQELYDSGLSLNDIAQMLGVSRTMIIRTITPNRKVSGRHQDMFRIRWSNYTTGALKRGLPFELTQERFRELLKGNCHYCNMEPQVTSTKWQGKIIATDSINGIDRVDSSLGYVEGNVVSCCTACNRAKNNLSIKDFEVWLDNLALHRWCLKNAGWL